MPDRDTFDAPFERPRALFLPFAPRLVVEADTPLRYTLNAPPSATYPRGLFFGAVPRQKHYVSLHLMPIYLFPDLLDGVAPPLSKRRHGKSCFNFTAVDSTLATELALLSAAGFERFQREALV